MGYEDRLLRYPEFVFRQTRFKASSTVCNLRTELSTEVGCLPGWTNINEHISGNPNSAFSHRVDRYIEHVIEEKKNVPNRYLGTSIMMFPSGRTMRYDVIPMDSRVVGASW